MFKPKIILFDGNAFVHRCYHTPRFKGLTSPIGLPSGAIVGVYERLAELQELYKESKIITIFDAHGENFRHDIYPEYKLNRKPGDIDLIMQFDAVHEMCKLMGFSFYCVVGVEADDVIATIAKYTRHLKLNTLICSGDKDLMQLVNDTTQQLTMVGDMMDVTSATEKMGVPPEQILDLLSLQGDAADNIPGVPRVGAKTACNWLDKYGSLEEIILNAKDLTGAVGESMRNNIDLARLSYKLATLKDDVELRIPLEDVVKEIPDTGDFDKFKDKWGLVGWEATSEGFDIDNEGEYISNDTFADF